MNSDIFLLNYVGKGINRLQYNDVYEYVQLMKLYEMIYATEEIDSCIYVAFQKYFCEYYNVNNPKLPFRDSKEFFVFFKNNRFYDSEDIGDIIDEMNKPYGIKIVYFSFVSKVLAAIDNRRPIYDSNIRIALGLDNVFGDNYENRLKCATRIYKQLCEVYNGSKYKRFREKCIKDFDMIFPDEREISESKKIDFVLWGIGRVIKAENRFMK